MTSPNSIIQAISRAGSGRSRPGARYVILAGLVLLILGLTTTGCEVNDPEMPTFTTSLTVPIGQKRVDILDLIEDEDYLAVENDGGLSFSIEGDEETIDIDFDMSADIEAQQISQGVGNFDVEMADPIEYEFGIGDLWGAFPGGAGNIIVPAFAFNNASPGVALGGDIESATLATGQLAVTITNNLSVPVSGSAAPEQITVVLKDSVSPAIIATVVFDEIAAGGTATEVADLAGKELPPLIIFNLEGGSDGSSGALVAVDGATDGIDISAAFSDLVVSEAMAVLPAQSFTTDLDMELPADFEIELAVIESGLVELTLENEMSIPCVVVMTWPELLDLDDNALVATFNLAAGATGSQSINFANLIVTAPQGQSLTVLNADVAITSPGSSGAAVPLNSSQGLQVDLDPGTLSFSSVTGLIPTESFDIDPTIVEVDLPDAMEGIELSSASMIIELVNGVGISGDVDFELTGTSESGRTMTLSAAEDILPAINRAPATTTIELNEDNSDIVEFLNNLPTEVSMAGTVEVGGDVGTIHAGDSTTMNWRIVAPIEVIINETTMTVGPTALDMDSDTEDMVNDHAGGAWFYTDINNHLPFAVTVTIKAGQDTLTLDSDPLLTIGPLSVASAAIDPFTRTVSEAVLSSLEVELTAAEAQIFGLPGIYTSVDVLLPSTDSLPVKLLSTDYLTVSGAMRMDVIVNDQW